MLRPRLIAPAAVLVFASALAGCGGERPSGEAPPAGSGSVLSADPEPTPEVKAAMDAKAVVDALAAVKLPMTGVAAQDEDTDPNDLLGRPNGYTSRASADVTGGSKTTEKYGIDRGLVVEVFATVEAADARSKFIQDTLKSMQILGTEYHYRPSDRRVLVRVTGKVKPSVAAKFETAVAGL